MQLVVVKYCTSCGFESSQRGKEVKVMVSVKTREAGGLCKCLQRATCPGFARVISARNAPGSSTHTKKLNSPASIAPLITTITAAGLQSRKIGRKVSKGKSV